MKKFFFALVAFAAAAMATSCTNEVLPEAQLGDEAIVSFTVSTPEVASRAYGDGHTANDLYYAVYLWDRSGANTGYVETISKVEGVNTPDVIDIETVVDFRLVNGNTYSILFWAENNAGVADVDWRTMTLSFNPAEANVEEYDAFWAYVEPFTVNGRIDKPVSLVRPFAQVNVGTADYEAAVAAGTVITNSGIEVALYTKMDLASGQVDKTSKVALTYAPAALPNGEDFPVQPTVYKHMGMNYVLVDDAKELVEVKYNYNDGTNDYQRVYTNVPVRRNYRTNIYGNLLTEEANYTVTIVPDFDEEPGYDVFHAFQYGGEVVLGEDMEIKHPLVVKAGVEATLNLNGKTIKNKAENTDTDVIIVEAGATLTINGEGTIEAVSGNDGYAVIAEGKVIINGGTYKAGVDQNGDTNAVVYARGNGKVYVNGGTFPNDNGTGFVLNKKDADRATTIIEARGGRFYNFNPADNAAEGAGTNFCPEGYNVLIDGNWYEVVSMAVVKTVDEFNAASANKNIDYISLAADINFGTATAYVNSDKTILGNGYKLTAGGQTTKNYGLAVQDKYNVTINNLKMIGCGGIYLNNGAKATLNDCEMTPKYQSSGRYMFYIATKDTELTINSGDYSMSNTGIKYFGADGNDTVGYGKINVMGGKFYGTQANNAATVYERIPGLVKIYGGQYYMYPTRKFDPTPYLAAGYKTVEISANWVEVVAE